MKSSPLLVLSLVVLGLVPPCRAAERVDPDGIRGSLVLVGGGTLPDAVVEQFLALAGGAEQAKLVVVPTASENADASAADFWKKRGVQSVTVLHTRDRKQADSDDFVAPLKTATAVWFGGGQQSRIADAYVGTAFERALHKLLDRGGVVGGTSAGAAVQSQVMIAGGRDAPEIATGFDLLPDAVVDQHFRQRQRESRLRAAVKTHPACVGFGIDESTALVVGPTDEVLDRGNRARYGNDELSRGRRLSVVGEGGVTVMLAASKTREAVEVYAPAGRVFDLTTLRKSARERAREDFPPAAVGEPVVPKGSLVIVGGGGMPRDVVQAVVESAGGPQARIVVLPTAVPDRSARREGPPSFFTFSGARNVVVLPDRGPGQVDTPEFLAEIAKADCVWFGGGRQWRFVDAYEGTKAVEAFHDVLERGGVIAGSSAGASIQGDYLARAHPLGNLPIMVEGYERGFRFLPGVAVDQHFAQRGRQADLKSLVETFPQYLGVGLDEATAILVRGSTAKVLGRGQAHFYGQRDGKFRADTLFAGGLYDLRKRRVLRESPAVAEKRR